MRSSSLVSCRRYSGYGGDTLVLWSVAADGATGNKLVLDGLVHGVVRATQETLKNGSGSRSILCGKFAHVPAVTG